MPKRPHNEEDSEDVESKRRGTSDEKTFWVSSGTKINVMVEKILAHLAETPTSETDQPLEVKHGASVSIQGKDKGVQKTITIAEIVKRRLAFHVHQANRLAFCQPEHLDRSEAPTTQKKPRTGRLPELTIVLRQKAFTAAEQEQYQGHLAASHLVWPAALDVLPTSRTS